MAIRLTMREASPPPRRTSGATGGRWPPESPSVTTEDMAIWATLRDRSAVAEMLFSYLTGRYWLAQGLGLIH